MRRTVLALFAAAALAAGCSRSDPADQDVRVEDAIVTLPAVAGRPGAAYFEIAAPRAGIRLQRVESSRAERSELHDEGMRPLAELALPAGQEVDFAPGGRHVMLFGLDPAIQPGARIPLTFTFAGAAPVTVEAEVRAPGDVHSGH